MTIKGDILIIGGGNMGGALASRWHQSFKDASVHVIEPDALKRKKLGGAGVKSHATLSQYAGTPSIVVLAVKPQSAKTVLTALKKKRGAKSALLVSIMAGVPLSALAGVTPHIARVMPNTPALIGEGMSAICAPRLTEKQRNTVKALFGAVGAVVMVAKEKEMHAVTAISGSGPAYLFAFMEALIKASKSLGLGPELSRTLVTQTMRGAALLADQASGDVTRLREQVTSPKGTTEAALKSFKKHKLDGAVKNAARAAAKRSKKLDF